MRRKLKLSWALIAGGVLVKIANTEGVAAPRESPLMPICVSKKLGEMGKGFIIKDGEVEVVGKKEVSKGTFIGEYGLQSVESGGQTEEVKVYGGEQIVLGEGSYAYNSEIYGLGETSGQQNVYDDGAALLTDVMSGGEQNIGTWFGEVGGLAIDTIVCAAGVQNVLAKGKANTVTLEDGALQRVYADGHVETLTINSGAISLVYAGATLKGEVKVNGSGQLYLYAGDNGQQTKAEEIILNGKESKLYSVATKLDGSSSIIQKLSGEGRVIFTFNSNDSKESNSYYSLLYVSELSGNVNFNFRVNVAERYGDYLFIEKGQGSHTVSIVDTGTEITNSSFRAIDLITDKSGKARFSLTNHFGGKTDTVDGGTYMYDLKEKEDKGGKTWYLAAAEKASTSLTTSSNTESPITESPRKEGDMTVLRDPIVSSYESDFSFYANDFSVGEDEFILQSFLLRDGNVIHISDDGGGDLYKESINTMVEGSGRLYVEAGGLSKNTTIGNGGSEVVREQGTSEFAIVYKGGKQSVEGGGTAMETQLYGGQQVVFGEGYASDGVVSSTAYSTIIYGQGKTLGQQSVYDDGVVSDTKVMRGGVQNLAKWFPDDENFAQKSGGLAINTEVFAGGMQRVLAGGEADTVTLYAGAVQVVDAGGYVKNLTINSEANSWIFSGAILREEITVKDFGQLHLYAGDDKLRTTVEDINLSGEESKLYSIAGIFDGGSSYIQNLDGAGEVIFTSSDSSLYYSQLHIDNLSGSMHFKFHVSLAEGEGDYLFIQNGSGNHTISVVDSGIEIADPSSTDLDLIVDKSGGTHFTLQKFSGAKIGTVDGGTYVYGLKQKSGEAGSEKIWYLSAIYIDNLPRRSRSRRHLDQNQRVSVLSTVSSRRNQAIKLSRPVGNHNSSDEQQPVVAAGAQTLADQMTVRPSDQEQPPLQSRKEMSVSDFLTTPSTDAVLSMSVAPGLIFHKELQTVRAGRGILDRSKKNAAFWTYAIKSRESVATEHIDFKLEQTGIVLGISGLSELMSGEFYIGGFGSYDQARVAHARGGISGINTYGIGAYATYFDHSGLYLDGVLKYNHYQNDLKAVSTNGVDIEGNYKQWVVGTSFEAGYRFEITQSGWMQPYAQFTWLQAEGKEIKLSNEMIGDISPFTSLRSEVGLSLGYEFGSGIDTSSMVYITAAWLRENRDNNHTTINQQHEFTTDLSGNAGKLGVGLSSLVREKLKLYAEAHYVKGQKVKQSLQGILGVCYRF
ncbi:BafA family autotransporter [Bartonella jaculi]|uniref:Autotransporter domain-containing protein n=1 Tax=Bartonella jaculi TaxID=686226 RepID=A0ABP9MXP4_9HYPH